MTILQKDIKVLRKTINSDQGRYEYGLFVRGEHRKSFIMDDSYTHAAVHFDKNGFCYFESFTNALSQFTDEVINDPDTFLIEITNS